MKRNALFALIVSLLLPTIALAAAPDGAAGPWADAVVTSAQGTMKNGAAVPAVRSNPDSAVGVAEVTIGDGTFFSLGFGGSITLSFDNGVRDGVLVVESTFAGYPEEKAIVEVSADGVAWTQAGGTLTQTGEVTLPQNVTCVKYVRVTDVSNKDDFGDDTADAYDVDGVKAVNVEACDVPQDPTPTPTPTQGPSNPNPTPTNQPSNDSKPKECTATKPGTPAITSVERTSGTTVKLTWSAVSPVTTYAISYGTSAGNYQYGVPSTGNVTTFTVGGLDPNATYYFSVRAINDCMPGDASGDKTTGGSVLGASTEGQVLGASTDVLAATGNGDVMIRLIIATVAAFASYAVFLLTYKRLV